jgi:uncharacterized protein YxjI
MYQVQKTISRKVITTLLCLAFAGLYTLLTTGCGIRTYNIDVPPPSNQGEPLKKYVMKQKILTPGERFVIKDETGTPVFYVKGKVFSVGDKLSFRDTDGNELAYISQKVLSFRPRYRIYRDNRLTAKVVKKLVLLKDRYIVDIPGSDNYKVSGNVWNYEYSFTRNGRKVASVSKKFFSWSDTYGIAIVPGEDDILILAAVVVIDMVSHGDQQHQSRVVY